METKIHDSTISKTMKGFPARHSFSRRDCIKNLFLMFLVLGLLTACQAPNGDQTASTDVDQSTPVNGDPTEPVPVEATTFETNITTEGLSVEQEMEVQKAADIIKMVVASQEFKDRILNHTVNGMKKFLNNNGLTNEEIYQQILDAAENHNLTKDNVMELTFKLIPETSKSRIYQIFAGIKKIFYYLNLFQNTTPAGIAQNLFQQWLGKLGFVLPEGSSTSLSVQEAVAKIIGELGKKYL